MDTSEAGVFFIKDTCWSPGGGSRSAVNGGAQLTWHPCASAWPSCDRIFTSVLFGLYFAFFLFSLNLEFRVHVRRREKAKHLLYVTFWKDDGVCVYTVHCKFFFWLVYLVLTLRFCMSRLALYSSSGLQWDSDISRQPVPVFSCQITLKIQPCFRGGVLENRVDSFQTE